MEGERIAKVMARAGLCSRREAEAWILAGRVQVNAEILNSPARNVTAEDTVMVDGRPLPGKAPPRVWLYHKPAGLITSHDDPQGRPSVFSALPKMLPRVISAGRLDLNTEGLLLLTNDGELAQQITHPSTGWKRTYRVRVFGHVTQAQLDNLKKGVTVRPKDERAKPIRYGPIEATLEEAKEVGSRNRWLRISIHEGRNREVRRICEHLDLQVSRLIRTKFGPFSLGNLPRGELHEVSTREVEKHCMPLVNAVVKQKKDSRNAG